MKSFAYDYGERLLMLALFAWFAERNIAAGDWINWTLLAVEGLTVLFLLFRRKAVSMSYRYRDTLLAALGTAAPLAATPGGVHLVGPMAAGLIFAGTLISVGAKLSLNRRFGLIPANRGVQAGWSYAFVRHPMYLGYIVAQTGYLLHNFSAWNATVYAVAWGLQIARIGIEERHLMLDEAYRSYASRIRYRLLPGLF